MTVTVLTRWSSPDVAASTRIAAESKKIWLKHGAKAVRLTQIFTGEHTGQFYFVVDFADMASYAKVRDAVAPALAKTTAKNLKLGAVLIEREILMGIDI